MANQTSNLLAIDLLEYFGNNKPTQQQIDMMESILSKITIQRNILFNMQLSSREKSCLYFCALGNTSTEIAKVLKIKTSTVETYKKGIIRKLACKNMTHAVLKGLQLGYVAAEDGNIFDPTKKNKRFIAKIMDSQNV